MAEPSTRDVRFFFDPVCPWTWVTSRWLVAAADQRDLHIHWRPYSLLVKGGEDIPAQYRGPAEASHRALRVIVSLAEQGEQADGAIAAFYTELGFRTFGADGGGDGGADGDGPNLAAVLEAAGLDPALAAAGDDTGHDAAIRASMDEAHALAGSGTGSPILALDGHDHGFFGPVLTAVPQGEAAGRLWDHYVGLVAIPQFHELKRDRAVDPSSPSRP